MRWEVNVKFPNLSHYPRRKQKQKTKSEKLTKWIHDLASPFPSSKYKIFKKFTSKFHKK